MDDFLKASQEGLKIVKDAGRKKGWTQTVTQEWWVRANTSQATLKRFWRGYSIDGSAFRGICAAVEIDWRQVAELSEIVELPAVDTSSENSAITTVTTPTMVNSNFVGREGAFAELNTKMGQGAKVIVIQAPGGVGKTTLAQEFLSSLGFEVGLELLMAKEEANITPVESVVEEWLKRDFQEEPGRDFGVMLGRLKRQLQTKQVGVLIDNLEPALDGQGRFIAPHRRYVELLRVLADSSVKSLTLITSREPLAEGLSISSYPLPSLGEEAWANFFGSRGIEVEATILKEIHRAYGGNALTMTIVCDPIQRDGGMGAYWQEHKIEAGLLVELAVENLVKEQFDRLEKISPEAYRLLCRLGCYRYQNIPRVPTDGLLCLLWDVQEIEHRQVIECLRGRSLVQCDKGEYWLHPVIKAEAITRLKKGEDWEVANRKSAGYWISHFNAIMTLEAAQLAFEAYHHYVVIEDLDSSVELIFYNYFNDNNLPINHKRMLGSASIGFGLYYESIYAIKRILDKTENIYYLAELYRFLGVSYRLLGNLRISIYYHEKSLYFVLQYLSDISLKTKSLLFFRFKRLQIGCLVGISHCLIDLGEFEKPQKNFEECLLMAELFMSEVKETFAESFLEIHSIDNFLDIFVEIYSVLSFLRASDGANRTAYSLAKETEERIPLLIEYRFTKAYALFFLGLAYKKLQEIKTSLETYNKALVYAGIYNTQLRGKVLTGVAENYRLQSDFKTALSHHEEAIQLLEKIGAKCDLAEAYYQLALTYQAMGEPDQSQEYFAKAIQLYEEMEAPKQVEKVHRAMIHPSSP